MSKKSKARNQAQRASAKRSRREANRAQYASFIGTAANRKNKNKNKTGGAKTIKHATADCGNLACIRCYPAYNDPWSAHPGSSLYNKRWSTKWKESAPAT